MILIPDKRIFSSGRLKMFILVKFLVIFLIWAVPQANAEQGKLYSIAVIPSAQTVAMHTQWTPVLERLTEKTGVRFNLKLFVRMADFEREIGDGTPDFIFASPIQTVIAYQTHRYVPLVRGAKPVSIGLFVRKDSPYRTIDDLSGKTISFVGNKNLCSVFVRHLLAKHEQPLSFASNYAGSTRNVIKSVLLGKSAAGAVFIPELEREPKENQEQLHSIIETPKIAPHPLSAHPRVSQEVQDRIIRAILEIASDKNGAELLRAIRLPAPVVADYRKDYQPLEIIDIRALTDWGK
ncbi:ABC transporter, phosphonate, periplasmic substrate-binding protein [Geobacter sp. OR-1]|uniref:phosphate/phosphite/phosphonate ABC transporter substrate-binding protein n=1 Tax=Geobacter sp. OR-1 TaxID=1266765 RepID=UPI0005441031|nr:phosphate/phosphite/phosphonate ABC transporter substrate-binding protein [Geobacter sp. OR-1]GAM10793.1 ABC transporter, phosphonate, periplasmic substrate-binding protein [Geobacter sp. OR-1]